MPSRQPTEFVRTACRPTGYSIHPDDRATAKSKCCQHHAKTVVAVGRSAIVVTHCQHATYGTTAPLTRPLGIDTFVHHTDSASRCPAASYEMLPDFWGQWGNNSEGFKSSFQGASYRERYIYDCIVQPVRRPGQELSHRADSLPEEPRITQMARMFARGSRRYSSMKPSSSDTGKIAILPKKTVYDAGQGKCGDRYPVPVRWKAESIVFREDCGHRPTWCHNQAGIDA